MIEFAYPPTALNPNSRVHWSKRASMAKSYKHDCLWRLKIAKPAMTLKIAITFHPRKAGRVDRDNCIAAFKYGQDALAEFWGVDDSKFEITYKPLGKPVKGGKVVIECLD